MFIAYWPQSRHIHTYYLQVQQACEAGESSLRKAQVTQLVKWVKDSVTKYRGENICCV